MEKSIARKKTVRRTIAYQIWNMKMVLLILRAFKMRTQPLFFVIFVAMQLFFLRLRKKWLNYMAFECDADQESAFIFFDLECWPIIFNDLFALPLNTKRCAAFFRFLLLRIVLCVYTGLASFFMHTIEFMSHQFASSWLEKMKLLSDPFILEWIRNAPCFTAIQFSCALFGCNRKWVNEIV